MHSRDEQDMRNDRDREQSNGYHVAQVCLNGHSINDASESFPQYNQNFCAVCGAETITTCRHCNHAIRGAVRGEVNWGNYHPPAFCHNCGKPYPWMEDRLQNRWADSTQIRVLGGQSASTVYAIKVVRRRSGPAGDAVRLSGQVFAGRNRSHGSHSNTRRMTPRSIPFRSQSRSTSHSPRNRQWLAFRSGSCRRLR
jgi:hypothetical protein